VSAAPTAPTPWREAIALAPPVDEVGLLARAARLKTRSIKTTSKAAMLDLLIRSIDLTTLEGSDTPGKVRALCAKAVHPDPTDPSTPSVAAVCVYPARVPDAAAAVAGTGVHVASVAGSFPAGLSRFDVQLDDIRAAVDAGADEIDIVLNRGAFLAGDLVRVADEVMAAKEACGDAHLKVILETGELGSWDNVRRASALAISCGADFIKTSTGKISPASTHATALCMSEAIRDEHDRTGHVVGIKLAGGIRTAKDAWHYAVIIGETLDERWLRPELFRLGASSLLDDVLMQRRFQRDRVYPGTRDITVA
jgi:deoxyribose-phosphate aldolase